MFTIKLYGHDSRQIIRAAHDFTILRDDTDMVYEITLHQETGNSVRFDVGPLDPNRPTDFSPPLFNCAYIVNAAGKTIESLSAGAPTSNKQTKR